MLLLIYSAETRQVLFAFQHKCSYTLTTYSSHSVKLRLSVKLVPRIKRNGVSGRFAQVYSIHNGLLNWL